MELKLYQVDAFTDRLFGGNPAAVMPLREELPEALMQSIAAENTTELVFMTNDSITVMLKTQAQCGCSLIGRRARRQRPNAAAGELTQASSTASANNPALPRGFPHPMAFCALAVHAPF